MLRMILTDKIYSLLCSLSQFNVMVTQIQSLCSSGTRKTHVETDYCNQCQKLCKIRRNQPHGNIKSFSNGPILIFLNAFVVRWAIILGSLIVSSLGHLLGRGSPQRLGFPEYAEALKLSSCVLNGILSDKLLLDRFKT